ncbi:hypothetical protein PHMEG_00020116 [Phytophthora megakarya]|uniref:Uncharacterized protein n=1 Tax=Phytophthora megakarya TaxID=4795 RepID=A0A225VRQ7_9STRA|nr:hypothetical protein PHMEG_00020116 [Phytophthora megakarya]
MEVLRAENEYLRRELRTVNRENTRLNQIIQRRDDEIQLLISTHHSEKMVLINSMEMRLQELMVAHERLVEALQLKEHRITTAPESKIHGFATTIKPLRQPGVHNIRFIAGQEGYESRKVEGAPGMLFNFTETGNPIDLRNNFQREANARLKARIDAYLRENPIGTMFRCYTAVY